jgi:predicted dehydrogenase
MNEVRIGIIGSGFMGLTHTEVICKYLKNARLVAVGGGSRAPELAARYGVAAEASAETLVQRDDIDAVIITTPHALHGPQAIFAAQHGKHLLAEKPLATVLEDCDRMIELCHQNRRVLMTAQSQRFRQANIVARRLIGEGAIGQVEMVSERQVSAYNPAETEGLIKETAGHLLGHGIHNIDRARWFMGDEVSLVGGVSASYNVPSPHPGSSMTLLRFRKGGAATIWNSSECPLPGFPPSSFFVRVMGADGLLEVDSYGLTRLGTSKGWQVVYEQPAFNYAKEPLSPVRLQSFTRQDQEFVDAILEQRSPSVTGEDGRAAVEIALASFLSHQTGQMVSLPLPRKS